MKILENPSGHWIGLRGKIYRKAPYLVVKTMVSG
jgi:hypothetical protein